MTAQDVFDIAMKLIDSANDTADYADNAPAFIDQLHRELAKGAGVTVEEPITALTDTLLISDYAAVNIMPYGLAAKFALVDKDSDYYNEYNAIYQMAKSRMAVAEADITDSMYAMSGLNR